ncbi:MAG: hypothetical protein AAF558_07440 [Verrucomicrobiota bacterium]
MRRIYLLLFVVNVIVIQSPKLNAGTITVLGENKQTIQEWGCTATYARNRSWGVEEFSFLQAPNAARLIVKELGMTMYRVDGPYCWYYDKNNPSVPKSNAYEIIEHINICKDLGISDYILTVWSPPVAFKTPPVSS